MSLADAQFEEPLVELRRRIEELEGYPAGSGRERELSSLRSELRERTREIFGGLNRWQKTLVARHQERPYTLDYVRMMTEDWVELHGDRAFGDDAAIVAGLVAVTPACGFVTSMSAVAIGAVAGVVCSFAISLKTRFGYDDALDVFGVHCVGGIVGAILTGVLVNPALGGAGIMDYALGKIADYDFATQVIAQCKAVLTTLVWSGVVAFIAYKIVDLTIGLRVPEDEEREGLDITSHGETAYSK